MQLLVLEVYKNRSFEQQLNIINLKKSNVEKYNTHNTDHLKTP